MPESQPSMPEVYFCLYKSTLANLLGATPEPFMAPILSLNEKPFGAYLCQTPNDPEVQENEYYTPVDVGVYLEDVATKLGEMGIDKCHGLMGYVMGSSHGRLCSRNTPLVVASVIKYYLTLVAIRLVASRNEKSEGQVLNSDGIDDDDPLCQLYWESVNPRDQLALRELGLDMVRFDGPTDGSVEDRINIVLSHDKYGKYNKFVYSRSATRLVNSVTWMIGKAHALVSSTANKNNWSEASTKIIKDAVQVFAPSMKTSTTGSELGSQSALYIPKDVEATRLLSNLFQHHLRYSIPEANHKLLDACLQNIPDFEAAGKRYEGNRQKDRAVGGGGRN